MHELKFSPIGVDCGEAQRLQERHNAENLERLIACCITLKSERLNRIYERFRFLDPRTLVSAISNPLFYLALRNLQAGWAKSSTEHVLDGILYLEWLLDDFSESKFWAAFGQSRSIFLPKDGVFIRSTKLLEGVRITDHGDGIAISIGQSELELGETQHFNRTEIDSHHWLVAWRLRRAGFCIDSVSDIYSDVVPDDYEREWSSPSGLNGLWQSVSHAFSLVETCGLNNTLSELNTLLKILVPLKYRKGSQQSSSTPALPGVMCMSWSDDTLQLLEAIVHEAGHNKLSLFERDKLLTVSSDEIFRSPWREDPRPARGLIHGAYVFLGVAILWDSLLKSSALGANYITAVKTRKLAALKQIGDALSELERARCFTDVGESLVRSIRSIHTDQLKNCDCENGNIETHYPTSFSIKSSQDELNRLADLSIDTDWLLPSYSSIKREIESSLNVLHLSDLAGSTMKKRLPSYYLWWALPLIEAFKLYEKPNEMTFWGTVHLRFGFIWRLIDEIEDGRLVTSEERRKFQDAALVLLIENIEQLSSRQIHFSNRAKKLLFEFCSYRDVETAGRLEVGDIWRRASPFLVTPLLLRMNSKKVYRIYRDYCVLLGLLDDLEDAWEDLSTGRRTWITSQLRSSTVKDCRAEIQSICELYIKRLRVGIPKESSLWRTLLDDSASRYLDSLSVIV